MNDREIMTYTGKMFDFFDPKPENICIEDIAHALACTNRYTGHTSLPYSVAEHSIRCSHVLVGDPLVNLMHDAAEAYVVGDVPSPQKQGLGWHSITPLTDGESFISYKQLEYRILRIIVEALGLKGLFINLSSWEDMKRVDKIMMATEVRDLMPPRAYGTFKELRWIPDGIEPLEGTIYPWGWNLAEQFFLERYEELTNG
jgi:hypothetical protein